MNLHHHIHHGLHRPHGHAVASAHLSSQQPAQHGVGASLQTLVTDLLNFAVRFFSQTAAHPGAHPWGVVIGLGLGLLALAYLVLPLLGDMAGGFLSLGGNSNGPGGGVANGAYYLVGVLMLLVPVVLLRAEFTHLFAQAFGSMPF